MRVVPPRVHDALIHCIVVWHRRREAAEEAEDVVAAGEDLADEVAVEEAAATEELVDLRRVCNIDFCLLK